MKGHFRGPKIAAIFSPESDNRNRRKIATLGALSSEIAAQNRKSLCMSTTPLNPDAALPCFVLEIPSDSAVREGQNLVAPCG